MARTSRYSTFAGLALVLAAAAGGWYLWKGRAAKPPEYFTAKVTKGDIVQAVTATGTIQPVLDVLVSSQISGYINSLSADFNSKVKKGDLLATLLPTSYEAAVKSAEGDLANAQANLKLQTVNLGRDKELLEKALISQADYDTQSALVDEATAQVAIKSASLQVARTNLSYCQIRSPIDGIVIKRAVDIGNSVAASLSSPTLFEIGNDLTKMQIDAAVAEADIGTVADGQAVDFTVDAYPNRKFHGKVFQIRNSPQTTQNVVSYDVMIAVDNSDLKLKPGMTATVSIIVARRQGTVRLPNGALRFRMPDDLAPPAPAVAAQSGAPAAATKPLTSDEKRKALREIMQQVGFTPGSGAPTPDMVSRMKELAKERGIELPDRFSGQSGSTSTAAQVVPRTVYRLTPDESGGNVEAVRAMVGISDGTDSEVIDGLKEGDTVITGVNQPTSSSTQTSNPFGGGPRRM